MDSPAFKEYNTSIHHHPVVISIPHSGIWIPPEMKSKLKKDLILPNSDWYLPDFYDFLREQLLAEKKKHFPKVYLLDLHSFGLNFGADILLGSSFGTSCSDEFLKKMEQLCSDQGFSVKCNQEYAGGYITRHYGRQGLGYEAL